MGKNVVIIGAGEIGSAIGKNLIDAKVGDVQLWDKNPAKVSGQKNLEEIVSGADFVFFCVPSWVMRAALADIVKFLNSNSIIISLAKGIEADTLKTMPELLEEMLPPAQKFALLSGPMIAEELMTGGQGFALVATKSQEEYLKIKELFRGSNIFVEFTDDLSGTAFGSVLKNVYAVGLGIIDGLKWNSNVKGWFAARALQEMMDIVETLGGRRETMISSAGLGDLLTTGFNVHSLNHQLGDELVATGKFSTKSEGLISIESVYKLLGEKGKKYLLFNALIRIIVEGENIRGVFEKLLVLK